MPVMAVAKAPRVIWPTLPWSKAARSARARSIWASMTAACSSSSAAWGVSRTPRPWGSSRGTPASRLRAEICWEMAEGVRFRAAAVAATVPCIRSSRSTRRRRISIVQVGLNGSIQIV